MTAVISIRWLVVCAPAPLAKGPSGTAHAQPPGPGFPRQEPSVNTRVSVPPAPIRSPACIGTARPVRPFGLRLSKRERKVNLR